MKEYSTTSKTVRGEWPFDVLRGESLTEAERTEVVRRHLCAWGPETNGHGQDRQDGSSDERRTVLRFLRWFKASYGFTPSSAILCKHLRLETGDERWTRPYLKALFPPNGVDTARRQVGLPPAVGMGCV